MGQPEATALMLEGVGVGGQNDGPRNWHCPYTHLDFQDS